MAPYERIACLPRARPFSLSPATSKRLLRRLLLVNNGWLDLSKFKVFVEFSADEHGLNGGLDF